MSNWRVIQHALENVEDLKQDFGVPEQKKFPLYDRAHVKSAIKFFNYVDPAYEEKLATAIINKINEYGMNDINVGDDNRFKNYYDPKVIEHHGIKGMKWGVRRYQNPDGSLTDAGMKRYYGSINRSVIGQRKIAAGPIATSAGLSAAISMPAGPIGMLTAATVASGASFALQALRVHGTKKADKFALENKKAYLKAVDKKNAELYEETGSMLFKTNLADNEKDVDIASDGKNTIVAKGNDTLLLDAANRVKEAKRIEDKDTTRIVDLEDWTDPIDKNGHYRWDEDGNTFYNKSKSDIAKEKAGNSKLNDITNDQYELIDRDLFEDSGPNYARQPLKTRQKLISDYNDSYIKSGHSGIDYMNHLSSRPKKEQTLRNNYEAYMNKHPNSDLTFNEFNSWFYYD